MFKKINYDNFLNDLESNLNIEENKDLIHTHELKSRAINLMIMASEVLEQLQMTKEAAVCDAVLAGCSCDEENKSVELMNELEEDSKKDEDFSIIEIVLE
mgnify:CR=1